MHASKDVVLGSRINMLPFDKTILTDNFEKIRISTFNILFDMYINFLCAPVMYAYYRCVSDSKENKKKSRKSLPKNKCIRYLLQVRNREKIIAKTEDKLTEELDILNVL